MVGDFILQTSDQAHYFTVEHKHGHFLHNTDHTLCHRLGKIGTCPDGSMIPLLQTGAQFDFFWTETNDGHAYLFPRDHLPQDWTRGGVQMSPSFNPGVMYRNFRVTYDQDHRWVHQVRQIMMQYGNAKDELVNTSDMQEPLPPDNGQPRLGNQDTYKASASLGKEGEAMDKSQISATSNNFLDGIAYRHKRRRHVRQQAVELFIQLQTQSCHQYVY